MPWAIAPVSAARPRRRPRASSPGSPPRAPSVSHSAAGQQQAGAAARTALRRHRRFQAGLWQLFAAPRLLAELAAPDTLICRCEELSRAEIEAGIAPGSESIGAVKRQTRGGMGRCQGRYCGPVIAALSAERRGEALSEAGHWAPRPPVKPIRIGDIVG